MSTQTFRRTLAALAAVASLAAAPTAALAADNGSGPTSDNSEICNKLLDRMKRYHAISKDRSQPKAVRDYYASQAEIALIRAKDHGCSFVAINAGHGPGVVGANEVTDLVATPVAPAASVKVKAKFDRLQSARSARRSARIAGGSTTGTVPKAGVKLASIKASPTGNQNQDAYCAEAAKLIDEAFSEGDAAFASGDHEGAQAWWDLAYDFIDRATQNGCRFTAGIRGKLGAVRIVGVNVIASRT